MAFFSRLNELAHRWVKKPWCSVEVVDILKDGRLEMKFSWNSAMINQLFAMGFSANTEEELIQQFMMASQALPIELLEAINEDVVSPQATPNLTNEANKLLTG